MMDSVTIPKWVVGLVITLFLSISGALFGVYQSQLNQIEQRLTQHTETEGHPVISTRMHVVEKRMDDIRKVTDSLAENIQKVVRNQVRMCAKEGVQCER